MKQSGLLTWVLAAAILMAGAAQAGDGNGDAAMSLGQPVAAPPGFIALCETSPEDCARPNATAQALQDVRLWAGRARWSQTFQAAGLVAPIVTSPAPAASTAPAAMADKPTRDAETRRAAKDAERKALRRAHPVPRKATASAPATPEPPASAAPAPVINGPPRPTVRDLQAINSRINRAIRRSTDLDHFGQADVWTAPSGPRARGDCEDYVLAKRRALIEAGVDPALLAIALVTTRRGEAHAVLLVATDEGEQVLDNLSPWVLRWDVAPYEWQERQAPGEPLVWVRPASGR